MTASFTALERSMYSELFRNASVNANNSSGDSVLIRSAIKNAAVWTGLAFPVTIASAACLASS